MQNEDTPQLQCVALDTDLTEAGATGPQCVAPSRRAQQARDIATQPRRRVGASLLIHQQGKREFLFIAECGGMRRTAVPDDHELGPARVNLRQDIAQLRDLLAAEDSAEVADESQNDGSLAPQGAEPHAATVGIEQFQTGQTFGDSHERPPGRSRGANQGAGEDCDRSVQPMSLYSRRAPTFASHSSPPGSGATSTRSKPTMRRPDLTTAPSK